MTHPNRRLSPLMSLLGAAMICAPAALAQPSPATPGPATPGPAIPGQTAPTPEGVAPAVVAPVMETKLTPDNVGHALSRYGIEFNKQRDGEGDPILVVRPGEVIHEQGMAVIFYNCDDDDQCNTASFYTYFRTSSELDEDIYHVWNDIFRVRTWTKAFKDTDGDTGLALNVNSVGGISKESMEFLTGVFLTEMNAFRDALTGVRTGRYTTAELAQPGGWSKIFNSSFGAMALNSEGEGPASLMPPKNPKAIMGGGE